MIVQTLLLNLFLVSSVWAETHVFNWTTGWVNANPDGNFERPVMACNGEFPWPTIRVNKGDRVELYLTNGFSDMNTTLHFHGLFQEGSNEMDGPPMVNQCPIAPGDTMLYNFTVTDQVGTYWYHSHTKGYYMEGMRGLFIIEDEDFPYDYDEEVILSVSDWYHDSVDTLTSSFLSVYNPTGAEPIPSNLLFNNTRNGTWHVEPNKTYLLRIANIGGFVSQYLYMEDHEFEIVAVDGIYVEKNTTDLLYITVAQRYDVLVRTKNDTSANYCFMQKFDDGMLDVIPDDLILNATSWIVYDDSLDMPDQYYIDDLTPFDDFYLVPYEKVDLLEDYDHQIVLDVAMDNLGNGINYAFFNDLTYVSPKVPTLATVFAAGDNATNPLVYGTNTHTFVLEKDEIVEIVLNNLDTGTHPFHLHGHVFQVIERGPDYSDSLVPVTYNETAPYDPPSNPMRRDVLYVRPQSYFVLRFKADNPGVWFFHCHIEWHLLQGLVITLVEDPLGIQANQTLSDNWKDTCAGVNVAIEGNAAGNTEDYTDLTGQNVQPKGLPAGFTARGIVALVFSVISGVLGCIAIGFYGMAEIPDIESRVFASLTPEERQQLLDEQEIEMDNVQIENNSSSSNSKDQL